MEELTKEQKMDMVSKAIDAGFKVDLFFYNAESSKQLNELSSIFNKKIDREITCTSEVGKESTWMWINQEREFVDDFGATIHIDNLKDDEV